MPEIERYELSAGPAYRFETDRRDFFKYLGGGIVLLLVLPAEAQESGRTGRRGRADTPQTLSAWMHIGEDGRITFHTGKVEVGQNARTALTQAVAEELHAPPQSIHMIMGDTALVPYDRGTFGSQTTPMMAPQIRRAAAAAREWLLDIAAEEWKVDRTTLRAENGNITGAGKTESFGALAKGKNWTKTVGPQEVSQPAGESLAKVDGRAMVTGAHRYTSDQTRPGMLFGKVLRPAAYGASLVSVDLKPAEQIAGVHVVRDGNFVGVTGKDPLALTRALAALKPEWKAEPHPSSRELSAYLKAHPEEGPRTAHQSGSISTGLDQGDHKLAATYNIAYIAHVPLEPRAAMAEWNGDQLTVWTGTQVPFGVRSELAEAFKIAEDRVRVIVPDTGSGYGGKHTGECALEAARLAKSAGKPVKLVWTREEEFSWAYFRPAGVIDIRSAVRKDGVITAWEFTNYNSGMSGIACPYDVANQNVLFQATKSPLRQGSYRGLAATANHFARESHMDELASVVHMDPLQFRLKNLSDPRMKAVVNAAADRFGWQQWRSRPNVGLGIACGFEKGGYVASCASVTVDKASGRIRIDRVVTAFECGAIVNPKHLENQVEGAVMMGIGGAMFEAIEFENGRLTNGKLSKYRVPRFGDMPLLETVLVDRKDLKSTGAGETPIVALAPAVGNAIFAATGQRLRALPMAPQGLKT